ncbi:MAG: hypothetical protein R3B96_08735 [Pirellulaceae bacterium]
MRLHRAHLSSLARRKRWDAHSDLRDNPRRTRWPSISRSLGSSPISRGTFCLTKPRGLVGRVRPNTLRPRLRRA